MIYERRIYTCMPGKQPAVLDRFEKHVLTLWKKHGYQPVGFWTEMIGEDSRRIHYMLSWQNLAEREKSAAEFAADPDWKRVRDETEKDGPLVESVNTTILAPTPFSNLK